MPGPLVFDPAQPSGAPTAATPADLLTTAQVSGLAALVSGAWNPTAMPRVVLLGDSQTLRLQPQGVITAVTRTSGIAYATAAGNLVRNGQTISVFNMLDLSFNAFNVTATSDGTTIQYACPGPDGTTTNLSTATPNKPMGYMTQGYKDTGYFVWLNSLARGSLNLVRNVSANGHQSSDMAARVVSDCNSIDHDILIVWTGSNDFATPATSRTAAAVYADVLSIIALSSAVLIVVVSAIPYTTGAAGGRAEALKYNRMMRAYCLKNKRVRFADAAARIIDPTNGTAFSPLANMLDGTDGLHVTPLGVYQGVAPAIYSAIKDRLPTVDRLITSPADNYGTDATSANIFDRGPWVSGGTGAGTTTPSGGSNAGVSAGMGVTGSTTGAGSCAASLIARSDSFGYDQTVDVVFGAASDTALIGNSGYVTGRCVAGDKLKFLGELTLSGVSGSNLKGVDVKFTFNSSPSTTDVGVFSSAAVAAANFPQVDQVIFLESPEMVVPTGATGYTLQATIKGSASGGTAVRTKLGRMSMDNLAKLP